MLNTKGVNHFKGSR